VRKVVTVLFADVVGSTALGEATDPEALRTKMRSYFDDLRRIVERHGGTVEKFVGDAVMAVFGIPVAHEDDALRAVRAASEMRSAITEHVLEARIGVNTGEVVTGTADETLVTGDAVNVAARLEQAAAPGEALLGRDTLRLVRDAVRAELVPPLTLKGKSEPVEAYRLVEVLEGAAAVARHPEAPLVGRERERQRLRREFEDVVAERTCRLFTLLGPAGIGKSRLVGDFLERAADEADVLRGRCLHYGEGITYWPLVEILVALRIDPDSIMGSSPDDTRLTFRRLLETRAAERPQVVVLDDLQWAEPVFLDLVEHVADFSRDAPIFLLCIARTELLELRPGWGGGKVNATSVLLEPLQENERARLIVNLLGDAELNDGLRERIAEVSEGNPLFMEEMLAMVRESGGDGDISVPPTIQALLQARLDSLDREERLVIERGSVEGQVFHRGSVAILAPEPVGPELGWHLSTLVRKELIRPDRGTFPNDEAFRFRHLLIRDAAYESLPKATRAELHERFADWLAEHELVERDEILGYHLEQAYRYRAELDARDSRLKELGGRAAGHLATGGRTALGRGDYNAGRMLLQRAALLFPPDDEARYASIPDLAVAMWEVGQQAEARAYLADAKQAADPTVVAMASITDDILALVTGGSITLEERAATREKARLVLEREEHDEGLALYWWAVAGERWNLCRGADTVAACEHSLVHAARSGVKGRTDDLIMWTGTAHVFGPTPVEEAIERVEALRESLVEGTILHATACNSLGRLLAMRGDIATGRELNRQARQTLRDAGQLTTSAGMSLSTAWIEERAGDRPAAEATLRAALDELGQLGDRAFRSTVAASLAECVYLEGRIDEARELCALVRETTPLGDLINEVYSAFLEGCLLAHDVRLTEAEERGRQAIELADTTDFFFARAKPRLYLATTLARAGRESEAVRLGSDGLEIFEDKGDVTGLAWAQRVLDSAGVAAG
jgi:class 3 adenylate cyclase/tetratricopeptide (TPR) repeat protein